MPKSLKQLLLLLLVCVGAVDDPFKVLGVSKTASDQDIRRAFRRLSLKLHPDKNPAADSVSKFAAIAEAYELLSDPEKRREFEARGNSGWSNSWASQQQWQRQQQRTPSHDPYEYAALVTALSPKTYKSRVERSAVPWLIIFHQPRNHYCAHAVPAIKAVAQALVDDDVEVGAVDCEAYRALCEGVGVWDHDHYPHIRFMVPGTDAASTAAAEGPAAAGPVPTVLWQRWQKHPPCAPTHPSGSSRRRAVYRPD